MFSTGFMFGAGAVFLLLTSISFVFRVLHIVKSQRLVTGMREATGRATSKEAELDKERTTLIKEKEDLERFYAMVNEHCIKLHVLIKEARGEQIDINPSKIYIQDMIDGEEFQELDIEKITPF